MSPSNKEVIPRLRNYWQTGSWENLKQRGSCRQLTNLMILESDPAIDQRELLGLSDTQIETLLEKLSRIQEKEQLIQEILAGDDFDERQPRRKKPTWRGPSLGQIVINQPSTANIFQDGATQINYPRGQEATSNTVPSKPEIKANWPVLTLKTSLQPNQVGGQLLAITVRREGMGQGEFEYRGTLPIAAHEVSTVCKLLDDRNPLLDLYPFNALELESLRRIGLIDDERLFPRPELLRRIGRILFDCLFPHEGFNHSLKQFLAAKQRLLMVELCFRREEPLLYRLPWELLHDGVDHLVRDGRITLSRFLNTSHAKPAFYPHEKPHSVLVMSSRPQMPSRSNQTGYPRLSSDREDHVIEEAFRGRPFQVRSLVEGTMAALGAALIHDDRVTIFHADAHAEKGLVCRRCEEIWTRGNFEGCPSCRADADQVGSTCVLELPDDPLPALIPITKIMGLLRGRGLSLACLAACHSGAYSAHAMAGGYAQDFSEIPAIMALPWKIGQPQSQTFFKIFYQKLGQGKDLRVALAEARLLLAKSDAWYRPVLYLRCREGASADLSFK